MGVVTLVLPPALCRHHWRIETPSGPTSVGVCQDCDATRTFDNGDWFAYNSRPLTDRVKYEPKKAEDWDE